MKLPDTLRGSFIYYNDVPKTYAMYSADPDQFSLNMEQLKVDLKAGIWNAPKTKKRFSNYKVISIDQAQEQKQSTFSKTLTVSGIEVDENTMTYRIPEGYKWNKKTTNALLKLRKDGFKRSDDISRG